MITFLIGLAVILYLFIGVRMAMRIMPHVRKQIHPTDLTEEIALGIVWVTQALLWWLYLILAIRQVKKDAK